MKSSISRCESFCAAAQNRPAGREFTGKICGICNNGKLHPFKDEVAAGIHVDAYKCDNGGHISYSGEVMGKVEALYKNTSEERHLVQAGSSVAAPIPAKIVKMLNLKPREKVYISMEGNRIVISPAPA